VVVVYFKVLYGKFPGGTRAVFFQPACQENSCEGEKQARKKLHKNRLDKF
jgi:hypothetical protein